LWLLEREKASPETLRRAIAYARESLRWMVEQRIAREIQVTARYEGRTTMVIVVNVLRGDARRWSRLWKGALDVRIKAGNVLLQLSGA
jgi:phage gp46-like protein